MPRPPKKINPGAHRSARSSVGRAFQKGRFANSPATPEDAESTIVRVGSDDTATENATFARAEGVPETDAPKSRSIAERTITSKYEARPSTGIAPGAEAHEDVVIDLTDDGGVERRVVVDLSKLPPLDVGRRSDSVYIRHSDGWPTRKDQRD